MKSQNDNVFRDIASTYLEAQGQDLLRQLRDDRDQGDTTRLDSMINERIKARKRRRLNMISGLAAACVALCVLTGMFYTLHNNSIDITSAKYTTELSAPKLSAALPERLSVSNAQQDTGQSIYMLTDQYGDDVVLTMEYSDQQIDTYGLAAVDMYGHKVYFKGRDGYNMALFERDGVRYTMTCRYEMNTLLALSDKILKQL